MTLSREQKIQIAGLLHDIGKIGERAGIELSSSTQKAEAEYCPLNNGRYTHKHILWTVEFFKKVFRETLPIEIRDIMRWAALHHQHNLTNDEAKAVQQADLISPGHARHNHGEVKEDDDQGQKKLAMTCFGDSDHQSKNHPIFIKPYCCDQYDSLKKLSSQFLDWQKSKDFEEIKKMHISIWVNLVKWFGHIWNTYQNNEGLLITFLCEMQRKYLAWVPAITNTDYPKFSLYDHQRTTAGLAHCLLQDQNKCHYLIIEISGIQRFIYNTYNESKEATKILRGKSTFIELISEVITHKLSHLSITHANIFLNTKGKISYLLPASIKASEVHCILNTFKTELNEKYGHLIGFHYCLQEDVEYKDFQRSHFETFQKKIYKKLCQSKLQFLKSFGEKAWNQINQDIKEINEELCSYCNQREVTLNLLKGNKEKPICSSCHTLYCIGEKDIKNKVRVFSSKSSDDSISVFEGLYLSYHLNGKSIPNDKSVLFIQVLKKCSDFEFLPQDQGYFSTPIKEDGDVLSLDEMKKHSTYLAIVRADVDNLDTFIMSNTKSTAELASLSYQIQWFFRGRIQKIIEGDKYKNKIYPIYLTGDDFFIIGDQDILPTFLQQIRLEFDDLTYKNKKLGWSCAYQLFKSGTSLSSVAEDMEDRLEEIRSS